MNIKLVAVAKTDEKYLQEGIDIYIKRLKHYVNFELVVIPALKDTKNASADEVKEREATLLLKHLEKSDVIVLLDEHGKEHTSVGFSKYLQKQMNSGIRNLTFVVGGAFGFSPKVYAKATDKLSLSQMTFSHQMIRLFFVEQLYRAFTILNHEPYHNE
ncbi:MAG: 23S rRNA (pseudouridine(1915)-N(3))-methyltransferase RlmH [Bacteroidales bacterium]|jgi:23S rRNA (pseudouridine1915-N3)-methyltransferase|nr:23S rRNA (pseudouridine(1915)-N(3))-methyltransferase RlmH [Bacteroidales bacterium]